jgi:hypothetical protein
MFKMCPDYAMIEMQNRNFRGVSEIIFSWRNHAIKT